MDSSGPARVLDGKFPMLLATEDHEGNIKLGGNIF